MKPNKPNTRLFRPQLCRRNRWLAACLLVTMLAPARAHASMFKGEALDTVANVISWIALFVAPMVGIAVFWIIHILPEKIAERKQHPQVKAIQCLCVMSLFFGGLLWPLAWLWAYSKPVFYKMAYGTDKLPHGQGDAAHLPANPAEVEELKQLRQRVAELETKLAGKPAGQGGKG